MTITEPMGIIGPNPRTYAAGIVGGSGFLLIDIDNTPQAFPFANPSASGIFTLTVDDLMFLFGTSGPGLLAANIVNCPSFPCTGALTGRISNATSTPVPEPATLLLLATGVSGLAASVRRRRDQS